MQTNLRSIDGQWEEGFVLDQHSLSATRDGNYDNGHPRFDVEYTEAGAAVNALKYKGDFSQVPALAKAVHTHIVPKLGDIHLIVPMAPSNKRPRQPVSAVATYLSKIMGIPVEKEFLVKKAGSPSLKDIETRLEKDAALKGTLSLAHDLDGTGPYNVLLLDDLFESGASLDAACRALRKCAKIDEIYVAALTWRRPR